MQRADGSFGALIIRQPYEDIPPAARIYDHDLLDHVMIMQDWEHRTGISVFHSFHHSIGDNKPLNILVNGKGRYFDLPVHNKTQPIVSRTAASSDNASERMPITAAPAEPELSTSTAAPAPTPAPAPAQNSDYRRFALPRQPVVPEVVLVPSTERIAYRRKPTLDHSHDHHHSSSSEEIPIHPFESLKISHVDEAQPIHEDEQVPILQSKKRSIRAAQNHSATGYVEAKFTPYAVFHVTADYRYRFRTINSGFLNCPLEISIDNHSLTMIASDGRHFEPVMVETFVTYAGERFDFVVNANQPVGNYWIRIKGLMDCDERFTKAHQGAILRYAGAPDDEPDGLLSYDFKRTGLQLNSLNRGTGEVDSVNVAELTSLDANTPELLEDNTDYKFYVYYDFYDKNFPQFNHPTLYNMTDGEFSNNQFVLVDAPKLFHFILRATVSKPSERFFGPQLNHISMKMTAEPLLLARHRNDESKFCNASALAARNIDCQSDFCQCTHVLQVPLNATVEIILIDEGYKYDANHPFHLHGHDFRVVGMERIKPSGITLEEVNNRNVHHISNLNTQ